MWYARPMSERDQKGRDPVAANLASLNEIIAEMTQALAQHGMTDIPFARMVRETLRDHSFALGFEFQGERPGGTT